MIDASKKTIFFHVGTGKTGTTFLQYKIFPKLNGIYYIQRTRYKKVEKIINSTNFNKYLISNEFDQQLEREVKWFSSIFPQTIPIIVFRRHDSYIASQYRRFVKNGFAGKFVNFFDLENDKGFFKKHDLDYCNQIKILEKYFNKKPIVLIYEDLKENKIEFIKTITKILDVSVDFKKLNLNRKHTSYSEKQLKAVFALSKHINIRKRRVFKNNILHLFWRLYLSSIRYPTLYIAKILPKSFFSSTPLIPKNELEKVQEYYKNNWEECLNYYNNQDFKNNN